MYLPATVKPSAEFSRVYDFLCIVEPKNCPAELSPFSGSILLGYKFTISFFCSSDVAIAPNLWSIYVCKMFPNIMKKARNTLLFYLISIVYKAGGLEKKFFKVFIISMYFSRF